MSARQILQRPSRQLTSAFRYQSISIRNQSTTTKAKEAVQNVTSKASEGLSKVQSSASETVSSVAGSAAEKAKSNGGRIGRMVSSVQGMSWRSRRKTKKNVLIMIIAMVPVVTHQAKVALELGKIVTKGQGMGVP
jgi:F-type H+-transporting ATPase subunit g